ncbi:MAG TPA: GlsB/YeaQ/YmgE family stress response membrane protein [Kofleriaceae bacterium]|nr:GlsB/YeaQ/YmgE family stress response membrane protein [Kofleriaceae bacterium]
MFILLGGIAGWLASIIMGTNGEQGIGLNIAIGCVGALLGGLAFNLIGATGVTGFNIWSLLVALVGSVLLLAIVRAVRRA